MELAKAADVYHGSVTQFERCIYTVAGCVGVRLYAAAQSRDIVRGGIKVTLASSCASFRYDVARAESGMPYLAAQQSV